jgi:hypothetical protein
MPKMNISLMMWHRNWKPNSLATPLMYILLEGNTYTAFYLLRMFHMFYYNSICSLFCNVEYLFKLISVVSIFQVVVFISYVRLLTWMQNTCYTQKRWCDPWFGASTYKNKQLDFWTNLDWFTRGDGPDQSDYRGQSRAVFSTMWLVRVWLLSPKIPLISAAYNHFTP